MYVGWPATYAIEYFRKGRKGEGRNVTLQGFSETFAGGSPGRLEGPVTAPGAAIPVQASSSTTSLVDLVAGSSFVAGGAIAVGDSAGIASGCEIVADSWDASDDGRALCVHSTYLNIYVDRSSDA